MEHSHAIEVTMAHRSPLGTKFFTFVSVVVKSDVFGLSTTSPKPVAFDATVSKLNTIDAF